MLRDFSFASAKMNKKLIQSPLNYTGGKFKLLTQILPHFPKDINLFVDLFCGGCNVGINVNCNRVIFNDQDKNLLYLYNAFKNLDKASLSIEPLFKARAFIILKLSRFAFA